MSKEKWPMASKKSAGKASKKGAGTSRASKPRAAAKKKAPSRAAAKPASKPKAAAKAKAAAKPKAAARPKAAAKPKAAASSVNASALIDQRIRDLDDWRGETLARMRALILEAEPGIVEECKWVKVSNPSGVPVWSHGGIVCTGESYKELVKLTFAKG